MGLVIVGRYLRELGLRVKVDHILVRRHCCYAITGLTLEVRSLQEKEMAGLAAVGIGFAALDLLQPAFDHPERFRIFSGAAIEHESRRCESFTILGERKFAATKSAAS